MEIWDYIIANWWPKAIIFAAFVATIERLWKPVRWVVSGGKRASSFAKRAIGTVRIIETMHSDVKAIDERSKQNAFGIAELKAQFHPNGGSSIKDQLNHMQLQIHDLAKKNKVDMEMSIHGIFQCDINGRNAYVNKTYANMLGVTKEDLLGRNWEQYIVSDDYQDKWRSAFDAERDFHANVTFLDIDGNKVPGRITATRFGDGYAGYIEFQKVAA